MDHFLKKTRKIDDADATLMNIEESLQVATSIHPSVTSQLYGIPSPKSTVTETAVMKISKHNGLIQKGIIFLTATKRHDWRSKLPFAQDMMQQPPFKFVASVVPQA